MTSDRARRLALVTGATLLAAALLVVALRGVLAPLTQQTALPAAARWTSLGLPVPASAHRCDAPEGSDPGTVRWCPPGGVSAATLAAWYARTLPAGRDDGPLRWCLEEHLADGGRRALWSTRTGLLGYTLPATAWHPPVSGVPGGDGTVGVSLVTMPGSACPPAARSVREGR